MQAGIPRLIGRWLPSSMQLQHSDNTVGFAGLCLWNCSNVLLFECEKPWMSRAVGAAGPFAPATKQPPPALPPVPHARPGKTAKIADYLTVLDR